MKTLFDWALRLVPTIILLQTLFYKFTAAPESVYIFTTLGLEPWGRIGIGVAELVVAILILIPRFMWVGSIGAIGLMAGAIFSHLTLLGIEVKEDGGTLFVLSLVVLNVSLINVYRQKQIILVIAGKVFSKQH